MGPICVHSISILNLSKLWFFLSLYFFNSVMYFMNVLFSIFRSTQVLLVFLKSFNPLSSFWNKMQQSFCHCIHSEKFPWTPFLYVLPVQCPSKQYHNCFYLSAPHLDLQVPIWPQSLQVWLKNFQSALFYHFQARVKALRQLLHFTTCPQIENNGIVEH